MSSTGPHLDQAPQPPRRGWRLPGPPPLAAFVLPLLATLGCVFLLREQAEQRTQMRFERRVDLVSRAMQERLDDDLQVLLGYEALLASNQALDGPEWKSYGAGVGLSARHYGATSIGVVVPASGADAGAGPLSLRVVEPRDASGAARRDEIRSNAFRAPLEAARDAAQPVLHSGPLEDGGAAPGDAFTVVLPAYRPDMPHGDPVERAAALAGWVYGVFHAEELVSAVGARNMDELRVRVFTEPSARDPAHLLWDSAPAETSRAAREATATLVLGGERWGAALTPRPAFNRLETGMAAGGVLLGGVLMSLLTGGLAWSFATHRTRAMALAGRMTGSLRESEGRLRAIVDNAADAIVTYDREGRLVSLNPAAETLFDVSGEATVGRPVTDVIPAATDIPADGLRHQAAGRRADGEEMPVEVAVTEVSEARTAHRVAVVRDMTEQRSTEGALREGEERYRSLIATLQEGILMRDASGAILASNQSAERILGLTGEQLRERTPTDPRWSMLAENGDPFPLEHHPSVVAQRTARSVAGVVIGVRRPSGEVRWISVSAEPMLRAGETVPYAVVTSFSDITERRHAETALKATQVQLTNFLDGVPVGVFVMDAAGRPTFANAAARKLLGRGISGDTGPEQLASAYNAFVLGTNEPYPTERMPAVRALRGESSTVQDMEVDNGERRVPLEVVATPIFDATGHVEYAISAFQDVTERRRSEAALRASEERTRAVVDAMLEGLIIVDEKGMIESVNPAAERVFGYASGELPGQHLSVLMPPGLDPREVMGHAAKKSLGRVTEWEGRRKDGEVFSFELSLYAFEVSGRRRWAGHVRDVSERKEVERLKQEFLATVSHELRTPLTSIRGSLGLLASGVLGELPDEAREVVAIAERNSARLITLINDILDLERLAVGQMELNLSRLPLSDVVSRSVESVQAMAQAAGVALEGPPTGLVVLGDGDRLVQVLVNLLSNAVKFSPRGQTVRVETADLGGQVEVRVVDRGRGIPASAVDALFARFQQVEASDAREKGGTGLGLAICKAIVEQHGGSIGVTSTLGEGSTFWFRLPAAAPEPTDGLLSSLQSASGSDACDVLLVDDDKELLGVLARQLLREGLSVKTAETAADGVRRALEAPLRLLVLDLGLPDGDGRDVIRALRADPARARTPLLVHTARETGRADRAELTLGPTRYLTKSKSSDEDFRHAVLALLGEGTAEVR